MSTIKEKSTHNPFYRRRRFVTTFLIIIGLIVLVLAWFKVSPWPGAMVIRAVFNGNTSKTLEAMKKALPEYPVTLLSDQAYKPGDKDALLDVYTPNSVKPGEVLPAVIWTHGGAWLSGDKTDDGPYFSRMANEGFIVISLNYTLAPEKSYPAALNQLNDAHAYILANAIQLHVDPQRIVLAGDSAGSQLSSQLATIVTNPAYAKEVGVTPALTPDKLRAVMLFCGIYKMEGLAHPDPTLPKILGWGDDVAVWAYSGTRDTSSPLIRQMSPYYHVDEHFPTAFITGGNADPLTKKQSMPLVEKLTSLGVNTTSVFFPDDHQPKLPHEYQFTFNADGEQTFAKTVDFLKNQTH